MSRAKLLFLKFVVPRIDNYDSNIHKKDTLLQMWIASLERETNMYIENNK